MQQTACNVITLSSVVVVGDEGHLGDNSRVTLVTDLNLDFGTSLVETLLDVTHSDALLERRSESTRGDFTNLFTVHEDLSAMTSGSTREGETDTLLSAGLHLHVNISSYSYVFHDSLVTNETTLSTAFLA